MSNPTKNTYIARAGTARSTNAPLSSPSTNCFKYGLYTLVSYTLLHIKVLSWKKYCRFYRVKIYYYNIETLLLVSVKQIVPFSITK